MYIIIYILFAKYSLTVKLTALLGLGLAFCGSQNEDIKPILSEALEDFSFGFDVSSFTSLCYGLIYLASGDEETIGTLFYVSNLYIK